MQRLVPVRLFVAETVNATASVTSAVVPIDLGTPHSLILTMTSTGDAHDLQVDMQTAVDAAGTMTNATDFVNLTTSTATEFPNSATAAYALSLPTALGGAVQFTFTGVGANPADTALTATLLLLEDIP